MVFVLEEKCSRNLKGKSGGRTERGEKSPSGDGRGGKVDMVLKGKKVFKVLRLKGSFTL